MLAKAVKQPLPGLRDDLDLTVTAHTLLKWTVKWEPVCRHKAYGTSFSVRSISDWIKQQPPYTLPSRLQLWNGASLKKCKCKHFSSSLFSLHKCILWLMNNFWSAAKHKNNSMYFVWCQENKSGTECPRYSEAHSLQTASFSQSFPRWSLLFLLFFAAFLWNILLLALEYVCVLTLLGEKWLSSGIWAKANYPSGGIDHF